jgi:hypothetical protein
MFVSAAGNGAIAYRAGAGILRLTWIDRTDAEVGAFGPVGDSATSTSRRTRRARWRQNENGNGHIWMVEVDRGIATRLTTNPADDEDLKWAQFSRFRKAKSGRCPSMAAATHDGVERDKEIFFLAPDRTMMAATTSVLARGKQIQSDNPVPLFLTTQSRPLRTPSHAMGSAFCCRFLWTKVLQPSRFY